VAKYADLEPIVKQLTSVCVTDDGIGLGKQMGINYAMEVIAKAPTVDAVEVKHGRWEQIGYDKAMDRISCSCCKEYWNIADNDTETFNYCPNCGAKMDGDVDG
jgi:hypothetical protein